MSNLGPSESQDKIAAREIQKSQWQEKYKDKNKEELEKSLADLTVRKNQIEKSVLDSDQPRGQGQEEYRLIREEINFLKKLIKEYVNKPV